MNTVIKTMYVATAIVWVAIAFPVIYALITGDFPGAKNFYGLQEDDEFVSLVFSVREMFTR